MKHVILSLCLFASPAFADITLTATLGRDEIYIGESVLYQAILAEDTGVFSGDIMPPTSSGARIELVSGDFVSSQNGLRTLTRHYLISPKSPGEYTILPATFSGNIPSEKKHINADPTFGGLPSLTKKIDLATDTLTLMVKPKPNAYGNDFWLPSSDVTLSFISDAPDVGMAGEPLTYTLELLAVGVDADFMPTLNPPPTQHFRTYADKPERQNFMNNDGQIVGRLTQRLSFIPLTSGELTLSLPHISWYNTITHEKQTAQLPNIKTWIEPSTEPQTYLIPAEIEATTSLEPTPVVSPQTVSTIDKWGGFLAYIIAIFTLLIALALFAGKKRRDKKRLPDLYPH